MFRRTLPPPPLANPLTGRESGEHEDLDGLQIARRNHDRALKMSTEADRLLTDATTALLEARRNVRRVSERG